MTYFANIKGWFWLVYPFALMMSGCQDDSVSEQMRTRPNVVFILADDLGVHDLSVNGSQYYETPHIDRIAREGTVFGQGYATSRVCSPSRASIMTGKFTASHGITDWIGAKTGADWRSHQRNNRLLPAEYKRTLSDSDSTLAEAMRAAGYTTFFAGKWHLGGEGSWPEDHGFDINKGGWEVGSPRGGYFSPWENPNLQNTEDGQNLSMRLAQETSRFMEVHQDKPFLAYLSFYAVHSPVQTTEDKWRKYRDKAEAMGIAAYGFEMERRLPIRIHQDNPVYAGLVEQMDDAVGLVLDKLDELGLAENTVVVFTSDNGGVASGDAYATSNLPLRGGKGYQWEGGIREPYFIKVPWMENATATIDVPVTGADFFPTILELVNLPLMPNQHRDGISLVPLLKGGSIEDRPLFWHYPHYGNQGGDPSSIIRKGPWKLIYYWEDDSAELYHLENDPREQADVSGDFPDRTADMLGELKAFLFLSAAEMPSEDPEYDAALAQELYLEKQNTLMPELEARRSDMLSKEYQPNPDWWGSR